MASPMRGKADYLEIGDFNAVCSMCGRKFKASNMVRNWQGLWRCPTHNEPRQTQDYVRGIKDIITPPWTQPPISDDIQICTYNGLSAIAGVGIAGCMIAGRSTWDNSFYPAVPAPPWQLTTDAGQPITTDAGQPIVSDTGNITPAQEGFVFGKSPFGKGEF
jgi:hypothetical protein